MRYVAYGLIAAGLALVATSLGLLFSHGLQSFLGHKEGTEVGFLLLGAAVSYFGTLVRRRANVLKKTASLRPNEEL